MDTLRKFNLGCVSTGLNSEVYSEPYEAFSRELFKQKVSS